MNSLIYQIFFYDVFYTIFQTKKCTQKKKVIQKKNVLSQYNIPSWKLIFITQPKLFKLFLIKDKKK